MVAVGQPAAQPAQAAAGINKTINFQGRLLNGGGAVVADGNYNIEFQLWTGGNGCVSGCTSANAAANNGGTLLWTEDWVYGVNSPDNRVTVKNGYFSLALGSICAFTATTCTANTGNSQTNTVVDFNQDTLWFSMNVVAAPNATSTCATFAGCGGDGYMIPFRRVTTAVYALQANSCTTCILQAPTNTAQNTITNVSSGVTSLTVNATNTGTAATGLAVNQSLGADGVDIAVSNNSGTAAAGLSITKTGASGTLTSAIAITQSTGTLTNGLIFGGTIANDITTSGANRDLTINPNGTGKVLIGGGFTIDTSSSGVLNVAASSSPSATSIALNQNTTTLAGKTLTVNGTTAQTTGTSLTVTGQSYAHTAAETGSAASFSVTDATSSTTAAMNATTNGLNLATTLNVTSTGTGTKTLNGLNVAAPTLTSCSASETCVWNGSLITTQATGAGANITQNALNIAGSSVAAGAQNAVNIGQITPAAGTNTAINLGQGWDTALQVKATGAVTQTKAMTGINLDYNTSFTAATGQNITGLQMSNPGSLTVTSATTYTGINLGSTAGSYTTNGGNFTYTGVKITNPNLTQTANTALANGISVTNGSLTTNGTQTGVSITTGSIPTAGTQNGLAIVATGVAAGTLNGVSISGITGSGGTETAINIGSGWDKEISLGNSETIDNTTDGTVNVAANSGAITLKLTGTAATLTNSAGNLTLDSASNTLAIAASDTTLQRTASGAFSVDLNDAGTTKLAVINSGGGAGIISAKTGFQINSAVATAGHYLRGDGTQYSDSTIQTGDIPVCNGGCTGNYISNTTTQQTANMNIVSAAAGSIGALVQGAASATQPVLAVRGGATPGAGGDLAVFQDNTPTTLLTVTSAGNLLFGTNTNHTISVATQTTSNTAGNNLTLQAATGNGTGAGGTTAITGGTSGSGATGNGGAVSLTGGNAASTNGSGGSVTISGGTKTGTGTSGSVIIKPQASNDSTTAFQIQNAAGATNLLTADTTNGLLVTNVNQESIGYYNNGIGGIGRFSNLLLYSEQFDNAAWAKTSATATADQTAAPDGQTTADTVHATASGGKLTRAYAAASNTTYTFSVWLKTAASTQNVDLRLDSNGTPATGTAKTVTATTTWTRYFVTQTFTSGVTTITAALFPGTTAGTDSQTVYAWGAQLVLGSDMQVYTRTTDAVQAASQGVVSNGGAILTSLNPSDIVLKLVAPPSPTGAGAMLQVSDSAGNIIMGVDELGNELAQGINANNTLTATTYSTVSNVFQFSQSAASATVPVGYIRGGATPTSTADLLQLQDSSANVLARFDNAGNLAFGTAAHTISLAQAASGAGNNLTISAGQSGSGANNGGNLILQAGATGGTGTTGSVIIKANGTDSASAFQVQNAAGTAELSVDTNSNTANLGAVGSATNSSTVNIQNTTSGVGTQIVNIGSYANNNNQVNINGGSFGGTGHINIGADPAGAQTINIGTINNSFTTVGLGGGAIALQVNSASQGTFVQSATVDSTHAFSVMNHWAAAVSNGAEFAVDTTPLSSTIISDGSIESSVNTGWAVKQGTATGPLRDTSQFYIGAQSEKVAFTTTAIGDGIQYSTPSSFAAGTYTLSFYLKQTAGTNFGTNLQVGYNNGSDNNCTLSPTPSATNLTTTMAWTRFTCTFTSTGTSTFIYWKQADAPGTGRTYFIDALQLVPGTVAQPFTNSKIQLNAVVNTPVALQNLSDSTTAFTIQNAAGTNLMSVDTANSLLSVQGLATLQPVANLTNGQSGFTQSATFANATASGVVNGVVKTFTVSNSTAATDTGINLTTTDNSSSIANVNYGLQVTMNGSNVSQAQVGVNASATLGTALQGISSGTGTSSTACDSITGSYGACAGSTGTASGAGLFGYNASTSAATSFDTNPQGTGVYGRNDTAGTANSFYYGVKGVSIQTASALPYTNIGVAGSTSNPYSLGTTYGGYFTVANTSRATSGAALYVQTSGFSASASSGTALSSVAVLRVVGGNGQDNTGTGGVIAGAGALISMASGSGGAASGASGANVAGAAGAIGITAGNGGAATSGTGGAGGTITLTAGNGGNGSTTGGAGGNIKLVAGAVGTGGSPTAGSVIIQNASDSSTGFQIQNATYSQTFFSADTLRNLTIAQDVNVGTAGGSGMAGHVFSDDFEGFDQARYYSLFDVGGSSAAQMICIASCTSSGGAIGPTHGGNSAIQYRVNAGPDFIKASNTLGGTTETLRAYVYVSSHTSGSLEFAGLSSGTRIVALCRTSGGFLGYSNSTAALNGSFLETTNATCNAGSTTLTLNAWHKIEETVTLNAATGSVTVYLDNTQVLNATGLNTGSSTFDGVMHGDTTNAATAPAHTGTFDLDDFVVDANRPGDAGSLFVADNLHVGGTADFLNGAQFNNGSNGTIFIDGQGGSVYTPTVAAWQTTTDLVVQGGQPGTGNGGGVQIKGINGLSTGAGSNGGTIAITAGNGQGTAGTGGSISLTAGTSTSSTAGKISLSVGAITTTNNAVGVLIGGGFSTSDTTLSALVLDSTTTFAETGSTCTATVNGGALYYNSTTNAVRVCQDSSWSDVISTKDTNLMLFGVVPDSGSTNPGDLAGVVNTTGSGPCRVAMGTATNKVAWTSCVAYSGGRRVVVAAGNATTSANTASNFAQLCLTGANNQPALTTVNASETANLPWSATAPILCLATVENNAGGTGIGAIFDTRTFTTATKQIVNVVTTAPALGWMVKLTGTVGQYTPTTAAGDQIAGVVVASAATTTANTMNAIIATEGFMSVKSPMGTAGTVNQYIIASATTGKTGTSATANGTKYGNAGLAITSTSTTCTASNDNCRGSVLFNFMPN